MKISKKQMNIPDGWEVKKLGEIGNAYIGLTYSPKDVSDRGTLVLRSSNVQSSKIDYSDSVFVDIKKIPEKNLVRKGDILICARNGSKRLIGKNALITEKEEGNAFGAFMSIYRTENYRYFYQLFQSSFYRKEIERDLGPTINQVTNGNLLKFKFKLPSFSEQNRIVSVLETWDLRIDILKQKISLKKEVKKGLMQNLLTGKNRIGGFNGEWEEKTLKDYVDIEAGYGFPEKYQGDLSSEFPFYKVSDMNSVGNERFMFKANNYISIDVLSEISAKTFNKNSIIFPKIGAAVATNKKRILCIESIVDNNVMVATVQDNCDSKYFYYWVLSFNLMKWANPGGIPSIRKSDVLAWKIRFPELEEQKAIADILMAADEELEELLHKQKLLEDQKKYLLNNLISGEIRTPENLLEKVK